MWIEYLPKIGYHVDFALGILRIYLPSAQFYVLNSVKNCSIHCDKIYSLIIYVNVFQFSALWISRDGKVQKKVQKKGECMILWLVPPSLESSRHTNSIPFIIIALVMINLHKLLCPSGHVWLLQWIQTLFVVPFKFLSTYIFTRYRPSLNFDRIKIISHRIEKNDNAALWV